MDNPTTTAPCPQFSNQHLIPPVQEFPYFPLPTDFMFAPKTHLQNFVEMLDTVKIQYELLEEAGEKGFFKYHVKGVRIPIGDKQITFAFHYDNGTFICVI